MATETGDGAADSSGSADVGSVGAGDESNEAGGYEQFERSLIVTTVATLMGVVGGIASSLYVGDPGNRTALVILGAVIVVQFPFYSVIGMEVDDFGAKGNLYIVFMTFVLWFMSWTIILTTGAV